MQLQELLSQISNGAGRIILSVIGIITIAFLLTRKTREKVIGICAAALDQTTRKSANQEKILTLLAEKDGLSNSDIREALGLSERTVVRYMDGLEREGKVEQIGQTGRSVQYRLK